MLYSYTAKNANGETYGSEYEAADRAALYAKVRAEGGSILSVKEKKKGSGFSFAAFSTGFSQSDKIFLVKNLGSMLSAGLSITRALSVLEKQAEKAGVKKVIRDLGEDVSRGGALSASFGKKPKIFSEFLRSMARAGEESGTLADSLRIASLEMEKSYALLRRVRGALIYPAVIVSLMIVIATLLLIYMVPTLTATFAGLSIELPLSTRVIITASNFMVENTMTVIGGLALFILAAVLFAKSRLGRNIIDSVTLRLPALGQMSKEVQSARTSRTLSSLLKAGVPVSEALAITKDVVGNHLYKEVLSEASKAVERGETVSSVFARYNRLYPVFVSEMAAVGEETGKISEMLQNAAVYYEESVEEKTKNLSTIIEPFLLIIMGACVAIFAVSMLAPTYSLVDSI